MSNTNSPAQRERGGAGLPNSPAHATPGGGNGGGDAIFPGLSPYSILDAPARHRGLPHHHEPQPEPWPDSQRPPPWALPIAFTSHGAAGCVVDAAKICTATQDSVVLTLACVIAFALVMR